MKSIDGACIKRSGSVAMSDQSPSSAWIFQSSLSLAMHLLVQEIRDREESLTKEFEI
jgi:hypothetical protein